MGWHSHQKEFMFSSEGQISSLSRDVQNLHCPWSDNRWRLKGCSATWSEMNTLKEAYAGQIFLLGAQSRFGCIWPYREWEGLKKYIVFAPKTIHLSAYSWSENVVAFLWISISSHLPPCNICLRWSSMITVIFADLSPFLK